MSRCLNPQTPPEVRPLGAPNTSSEGMTRGFWKTRDISFVPWIPHGKKTMGETQLSNEKNTGWLGYIGDYTTQLYRDYNKPL